MFEGFSETLEQMSLGHIIDWVYEDAGKTTMIIEHYKKMLAEGKKEPPMGTSIKKVCEYGMFQPD